MAVDIPGVSLLDHETCENVKSSLFLAISQSCVAYLFQFVCFIYRHLG